MRIATMEELAAYLRSEIARIQANQATAAEADHDDQETALLAAHLEGELAAVQKTLVMVSDDEFADVQRERARNEGPLRPATSEAGDSSVVAPVALAPPWPPDVASASDAVGDRTA